MVPLARRNLCSEKGAVRHVGLRRRARRKGSGAVVASHDERLLEITDQVLWLEDSRRALRQAAAWCQPGPPEVRSRP
jgi:ABC-type lipoprotein export system ATPase subunit